MELPEIPGYRYVRKIGEGGFCEVHLAEHETFHNKVAVKIPKTEEYPIEYEAAVLEWLPSQNVNGIVPYYGLHQTNNGSALILGYAEETLEERLQKVLGVFEEDHIEKDYFQNMQSWNYSFFLRLFTDDLQILLDLTKNVENINKKGIVNILHGDLKPSNILIHKNKVTLCDFGFSTFFIDEMDDYGYIEEEIQPEIISFLKEHLSDNKYTSNWESYSELKNRDAEYLKVSLNAGKFTNRSLLFSKSVLEKSIALRGGTPSYQAPESLQGKFSGMEDHWALARIFEDILKWNKKRLNGLMAEAFKKRGYDFKEDTRYTLPANSYLEQIIQCVEENFLVYNPYNRPSFEVLQDFIQKTIYASGGLGMYSKKEREFLKNIKVEED
ncbi:MAG: protein kinase family protein [bacterium]|nr:protein kinase family protein [bacterium]